MRLLTFICGLVALFAICTQASPALKGIVRDAAAAFDHIAKFTIEATRQDQKARKRSRRANAWRNSPAWRNVTRPTADVDGPVSDKEWGAMTGKGCNLLWAMNAVDSKAASWVTGGQGTAESQWKDYGVLTSWGYKRGPCTNFHDPTEAPYIDDPLRAAGIDTTREENGGLNRCVAWEHTEKTTHNNVEYRPTTAEFWTVFNADAGIIAGWHKYSPAFKAQFQKPPVDVLPALQRWSDITFLEWKNQAEKRKADISNLKYVFSSPVQNTETFRMIGRSVFAKGDQSKEFDPMDDCAEMDWAKRKEYNMVSEEGKALLASPNGRGAAIMLIQHKSAFGQRATIDKATIWCTKEVQEDSDDPDDGCQDGQVCKRRQQDDLDVWEVNLMLSVKRQPHEEEQEVKGQQS